MILDKEILDLERKIEVVRSKMQSIPRYSWKLKEADEIHANISDLTAEQLKLILQYYEDIWEDLVHMVSSKS